MSEASITDLFFQEQAAAAALSSDDDKEMIRKLIKSQERSEMYKILHHVFKPANTGAISHLTGSATRQMAMVHSLWNKNT
jgi:hypothetical protein